LVIGNRKQKAY